MKQTRGFTILEAMVVVGVIALLFAIVIVAVNPGRHFSGARNAQRQSDLEKILGAINQYSIEGNGSLPSAVSSTLQMIGTTSSGCIASCTNSASTTPSACVNLASTLVPTYIDAMPFDPLAGSSTRTYYAIQKISKGSSGNTGILLRACAPELNKTVEVRQ